MTPDDIQQVNGLITDALDQREQTNQYNPSPIPNHTHNGTDSPLIDSNANNIPTLPIDVADGGTGLTSITAHNLLVGNGTSSPTLIAPGASGTALVSNGVSADPSYQAIPYLPNQQTWYSSLSSNTTANQQYSENTVTADYTGGSSSNFVYFAMSGSVNSNTVNLYYFKVDTTTGQLIRQNNNVVQLGGDGITNGFGYYPAMCVMGGNVYISMYSNFASAYRLFRLTSTLGSQTTMTISGTAPNGGVFNHPIASDGTYLYISDGSVITTMNKYSVSGSTATFVSQATFSGLADAPIYSDGTYVYQLTSNGGYSKWAIAGGSSVTSATYYFTSNQAFRGNLVMHANNTSVLYTWIGYQGINAGVTAPGLTYFHIYPIPKS